MANDSREVRTERNPVFILAWGVPSEAEGSFNDAALWLTGAVSLVAWTALALLLTSA